VGDTTSFAGLTWGREPAVFDGATVDGTIDDFADVFSVDIADELIRHAARRPTIRLVNNGSNVDPGRYTVDRLVGGRWVEIVDDLKLTELFAAGSSVVFQTLHRTSPSVGSFVRDLALDISHPIQANAYLTPARSTALAPHADAHDVIVVQLHGSKRWNVDGLGSFVLSVGDRMYIPAGTTHSAESCDQTSLHLTIGISRTTLRSVLGRALDGIDELRAPLPLDYGRDGDSGFGEQLAVALSATITRLEACCPAELVEAEQTRHRGTGRTNRTLSGVIAAESVGPDVAIRWVCDHVVESATDEDPDRRLRITGGRRTVRIPTGARDALNALQSPAPMCVGDLPGLDASSRIVVARRLLEEGVCAIDT
jgi:hypothetical protein